jgi:1-phosphofructokinase
VFGPDPLLSVTIEACDGRDEVHVHPAGQGVWVARMVAELGAQPVLCGLLGGETGTVLRPLLEALPGELRAVATSGSAGSYVIDRRADTRSVLAMAARPAPHRHELDDLLAETISAALASDVLVVCNPYPADGFPVELYDRLLADARAEVRTVVDLSSPRLDHTLAQQPDLVKCSDWELAEYVRGPVDGRHGLDAARRLIDAGARAVAVTRAAPPPFSAGYREGTGDAMTGAVAAGLARGMTLREALVLGAAAGAGNFLRHGLGTGHRRVIEALTARVVVRPFTVGA